MDYTGCRPLSEPELEAILDGITGRYSVRDTALIVLGVHTGYRISELLSLRVGDVWDGRTVRREVVVAKGYMKGKARQRRMPLHERAREAIEAHIMTARLWHPLFSGWALFARQGRSEAIEPRQAYEIIRRAAVRAGLAPDRIGTHTLRKTFARRMWESPVIARDPAKMARLLGHENWSNTLRYLEFADELDEAVLGTAHGV